MAGGYQPGSIYRHRSGLVLGFHGCDEEVGESILQGAREHLDPSVNEYDWLGNGVYFWENDPDRALQFAKDAVDNTKLTQGRIKKPFVIGAILDLRLCLDFQESAALLELERAYQWFVLTYPQAFKDKPFPRNVGEDRGARFLDASVIASMHKLRALMNVRYRGEHPPYHSVRGAFWEGGELFPGAGGFTKKSHIQIAVRDVRSCIKGYFRPLRG